MRQSRGSPAVPRVHPRLTLFLAVRRLASHTLDPQSLMTPLLKAVGNETLLPASTAQACLPYWLEAAGWWAAVQCDASALAARHLADYPSMAPDSKQQVLTTDRRITLHLSAIVVRPWALSWPLRCAPF